MDKKAPIHKPDDNKYLLSDQHIQSLIAGYLTNDLHEDDLAILNDWIQADKKHKEIFNDLKSSWIVSGNVNVQTNRKAEWKRLSNKIQTRENEERQKRQRSLRINILRFAASFLLFASVGALSMYLWFRSFMPEDHFFAKAEKETVVEAPLGSISKIILPDSSVVWLNAGSVIRYSSNYGDSLRSVALTGEAFFSVQTDPEKPFTVNVNKVTVRALGTKFNVKAYPEDQSVTATLEEGIIDINISDINHETIVLKPKEKVIVRRKEYAVSGGESIPEEKPETEKLQNIVLVPEANPATISSWKEKQWKVDNEPVTSFASMLTRRYNYPVLVRDEELSKYRFSGTIENESIERILEALRQTAPLNYTVYKDSIVLTMNYANKAKFVPILKN